ncbi:SatD family protein [Brassicibacter mesophilus]|uniref:SatD family protein n=1 Tax=Brassicibacter mesophilus TaxID=745119 RepID=UPI003D2206C3
MCIYSVINIDMINSRKLHNRSSMQSAIKNYVQTVNMQEQEHLLAPITFTLGDEWQIVLKDSSDSYRFIEKFQVFLKKHGIDIYAGIGIGTLSTNIYEDTRLMDGDCFIKAREALNIVKDKNRFYNENLNSKENNVYFKANEIFIRKQLDWRSDDSEVTSLKEVAVARDVTTAFECCRGVSDYNNELSINRIINALIENTEVLKKRITNKQAEMIELYRQEGSYGNMIRKRPEISKASISQKINDSNYFLIESNKAIIEKLFKLYCEIRKDN